MSSRTAGGRRSGVSLKEYFESKLSAISRETNLAASNMDRRLDSMNEFRSQLEKQAGTFPTRVEFELLREAVRLLQNSNARAEGKASMSSVFIAYGFSLVSIIIAIYAVMK